MVFKGKPRGNQCHFGGSIPKQKHTHISIRAPEAMSGTCTISTSSARSQAPPSPCNACNARISRISTSEVRVEEKNNSGSPCGDGSGGPSGGFQKGKNASPSRPSEIRGRISPRKPSPRKQNFCPQPPTRAEQKQPGFMLSSVGSQVKHCGQKGLLIWQSVAARDLEFDSNAKEKGRIELASS